jgi:PEP-CTERM motif
MLNLKLSMILGCALLVFAMGAMADEFNLTATGNTTSIFATLTGTPTGTPGVFDVTNLSGSVDGLSATLLATSGPGVETSSITVNGYSILYDNILNMNLPYFDADGLGFSLSDGTIGNLYCSGGVCLYGQLGGIPPFLEVLQQVSVTATPTPEPGTLVLLGTGLLIISIMTVFRRKQIV